MEREREIYIYTYIYIYYFRGFKSYPFTSFFGVHEGFTHFTWTVASVATLYPVMPCQFHHKRFGSVLLLQYRAPMLLLCRIFRCCTPKTRWQRINVSSILLAHASETGIYNFCNPGAISHNQVLELYRDRFHRRFPLCQSCVARGKAYMSPAQGNVK